MLCIFVKNTMEVILCPDQDIVSEGTMLMLLVTLLMMLIINGVCQFASYKVINFPLVSNKQLVGRYWDYTNILFLSYLLALILSFTLDYCLKQLLLWWTLSFLICCLHLTRTKVIRIQLDGFPLDTLDIWVLLDRTVLSKLFLIIAQWAMS